MMLYLFIILFALQNHLLSQYNFEWKHYESIVKFVFALSAIVVLASVLVLIAQTAKRINKKTVQKNEILYLVANIILYYGVASASLYLFTQCRL